MALGIGAIERCVELLVQEVRADEALAREFEESKAAFFRGAEPASPDPLSPGRRHVEWFLTEFHSPTLRGAVAEHIEDRYRTKVDEVRSSSDADAEAVADALGHALDSLVRSHTGIFEVEEVREGAGAWLRDVTGFGSFALGDEALSKQLRAGELIIGRLFPAGDGAHLASPSATVIEAGDVAKAIERDLQRIRDEGGSNIVRLNQAELEAMFFGAGAPAGAATATPPANPKEAALAALRSAGFDDVLAAEAMARLASTPRDPELLVHGGGDEMGRILEEIAFDTELDLDAARRALLAAWELLSTPAESESTVGEARAESTGDDHVKAIDAFAEGRARGGDALELLATLQRDLGIDGDESDGETDRPAPDFPGVVGAMIDEMKWEIGATEPDFDLSALEPLRHLATFAKPIGVFEELRGHDLFQFATFWLQEKQVLASDDEAVALVHALRRFCEWALDAQEVDVGSEFLDALDGLESSLPRMRRLNELVDANDRELGHAETGDLWEVVTVSDDQPDAFETSSDRVKDSSGEPLTVIFAAPLRRELQPGDRLRGRIELTGEARVFCAYPPEAAALTA